MTSPLKNRQANLHGFKIVGLFWHKALYNLTKDCIQVANKIIEILGKVTLNKQACGSFKAMKKALRAIWEKDQIDTWTKRLGEYRAELTLRVLLVLHAHQTQQQVKLDSAIRAMDEVVEVVSISNRLQKSGTDPQLPGETIAAIVTTRTGVSTTITKAESDVDFTEDSKTVMTYRQNGEIDRHGNATSPNFEVSSLVDFQKLILDALHFRSINTRHSSIPQAHQNTFEWVFSAYEEETRWDNLYDWMMFGTGCYWISGKAGSGKSSLMKYLQSDSRTQKALSLWAEDSMLLIGTFYFWYAGTLLQKSQNGLLRSLLFQLLSFRPELIPIIFPELSRSIISKQERSSIQISGAELNSAFSRLCEALPGDMKICFIVDGLDEYTGDHTDICELFDRISQSPSIKVLVSSRPIPACCHWFSKCPQLQLQDLTRNDIAQYVEDKISHHPVMVKLEAIETGITSRIINEITSKASGVFLWVVLVTRKVNLGLQNYDESEELFKEIQKLPPDLEKLYDVMLGSMSDSHQLQGSKYLQLVLRSFEMDGGFPMTALQLSFAENDDYRKCIDAPMEPLSETKDEAIYEITEGRMRSRCCGLIEVHHPRTLDKKRKTSATVGFLHRTVVEFLQTDTIWSKITALTENTKFDADLALLSSSLSEIKVQPIGSQRSLKEGLTALSASRFLSYMSNVNSQSEEAFSIYLTEMRRTLSYHWHNSDIFPSPAAEWEAIKDTSTKECAKLGLRFPASSILSLGIQYPGGDFADWLRSVFEPKDVQSLQYRAHLLILFTDTKYTSVQLQISRHIELNSEGLAWSDTRVHLEGRGWSYWSGRWKSAILPKEQIGWTPWQYTLHYIHSITERDPGVYFDFTDAIGCIAVLKIIQRMLYSGVYPNTSIEISTKPRIKDQMEIRTLSAFAVIREFMRKAWASLSSSGTKLNPEGDIACQMREIEEFLTSKKAEVVDVTVWRDTEEVVEKVQNDTPQKKSRHRRRRKPAQEGTKVLAKPTREPNLAPGPTPKSGKATDIVPPVPLQDPAVNQVQQSPWQLAKVKENARNSRSTNNKSTGVTNPEEMKTLKVSNKWQWTPKSERFGLLSKEEQQLTTAIASPSSPSRERRTAFNRIRELPSDRQEKVMECYRILRSETEKDV